MGKHEELLRKRQARDEGRDPHAAPPPVDENEVKLTEIRQRAEHVQSAHTSYQGEIMNERQHATEILNKAIEYGMPAIAALVGKIETRSVKTTTARADGGLIVQQISEEHFPMRGVLLVDRFNAVQQTRDVTGTYGGLGLYLFESGKQLMVGRRTGTWSRRPGDTSELMLKMECVSSAEALRHFRVEQILDGFIYVLTNQQELSEQATQIRSRADKLAAALKAVNEFLGDT